ncbi:uncharacterized protein LOC110446643 [Mizuhopecten yessoensis]|uniref:Uncharacterized protein n=1 Tax=Mizuhopecten yessoensis TaxID=6573 RepID=A0A210R669_MIZYE|nr:uncharacterized protein LOC110446643 [Mizuhopecten yessoensis]OWF56522.1 hypothetical protein KP79_PYT05340 [Mizuhopecten yessoensis]
MGDRMCAKVMMALATIMLPIVIVFMAVSFATDYWLVYTVDRTILRASDNALYTSSATNLADGKYSHTRRNGLFRTCYPGNDTQFLDGAANLLDQHCFHLSYDMPQSTSSYTENYITRIHLIRCWLAFFILALVAFLTAFVFGLILICVIRHKARWAYFASLFSFIAAFSCAASIAFFHGAEYMEKNKISDASAHFPFTWTAPLTNATARSYGYSYILGWVGAVMAGLTASFYAIAGCHFDDSSYERKEPVAKDVYVQPENGYYPSGYNYGYSGYGGQEMYAQQPYMVQQPRYLPVTYGDPYWSAK